VTVDAIRNHILATKRSTVQDHRTDACTAAFEATKKRRRSRRRRLGALISQRPRACVSLQSEKADWPMRSACGRCRTFEAGPLPQELESRTGSPALSDCSTSWIRKAAAEKLPAKRSTTIDRARTTRSRSGRRAAWESIELHYRVLSTFRALDGDQPARSRAPMPIALAPTAFHGLACAEAELAAAKAAARAGRSCCLSSLSNTTSKRSFGRGSVAVFFQLYVTKIAGRAGGSPAPDAANRRETRREDAVSRSRSSLAHRRVTTHRFASRQ